MSSKFYITGDMHGEFDRLSKRNRPIMKENDYYIVLGDFGLLWQYNKTFEYNLKWLSNLPFTILWVQGNHENYDMIKDYKLESWNGGLVRKIAKNIILLERGQVFTIDKRTFFTFGGASSHDIQGGLFSREDENFEDEIWLANHRRLPYRIIGESWWKEELPTQEEMKTGLDNLKGVDYKVDYILSHCCSTWMQERLGHQLHIIMQHDILNEYFDKLEELVYFNHWYFGHYHVNLNLDNEHHCLYKTVEELRI